MKAQVLYDVNNLVFEDNYKTPQIRENEVLVKVRACGICGSDIDRVYKNGTYHFPTIIGHEFSGVVENAVGENEKWVGKRVSVFPLIPCMKCDACKKEKYQLCENYNYLGSRCDGGFAEYVAVPSWNLIEIPENVSFESAAMLEPAAVAVHSLKKIQNCSEKNILIYGAGTISSIMIQVADSYGFKNIFVAARNQKKLDYLKNVNPKIKIFSILDEKFLDKIVEETQGGAGVVVEGTGASSILETAIKTCRRSGQIILMGNPSSDFSIEKKTYWQILRKELEILGTWNSSFNHSKNNDWNEVFALLVEEKINLEKLITHKFKLGQLKQGLELMRDKKELSNKVMVVYE